MIALHHIRLSIAAIVISTSCAAAEPNGKLAVIDEAKVKVGGEIGRRIEVTISNNLTVNLDKDFLHYFRDKKGAPEGYVGMGKFLDATVNFAHYSGDPKVIVLKDRIIKDLLAAQLDDGYLGVFPPPQRIKTLWDVHEMVYIIHALVDDYRCFHNQKSLDAARRIGDYIMQHRPAKHATVDVGKLNLERAMIALTDATGDHKYLDYAVDGTNLRNWTAKVGGHAYTYMNVCLAQLDLYRGDRQPDEKLLAQSHLVIDELLRRDAFMIDGTCSLNESFHGNQEGHGNLGESCATAYLIRLAHYLLQIEENPLYGDIMERSIDNALFAAESPDGRRLRYFTCEEGPRVWYARPGYCCPGNFRRIVAELPEMIYYRADDGLLVNLYTPSQAEIKLKEGIKVKLRQETDYPTSDKVVLTLAPDKPAAFTLKLRIPRWCQGASVVVHGEKSQGDVAGGKFLSLRRTWHEGDRVELTLPMKVRLVKGRKLLAGKVAVMRGPMLFCLRGDQLPKPAPPPKRGAPAPSVTLDASSIAGPSADDSVRPGGMKLEAKAWSPTADRTQPPDLRLVFTEFADPAGTTTYLPASEPGVDDELVAVADVPWQTLYEAKVYKDAAGHAMPYRLMRPEKIEPGKSYPLVLFLHGGGQCGTDNVQQLALGAGEFAKPAIRGKHPCFVLAPQCLPRHDWVELDWKVEQAGKEPIAAMTAKPDISETLGLEILDKLVAELPVDKDRIYVTGLSSGGYGTWDVVQRRPGFFAAAMPVCGGGNPREAAKLKGLAIWAFHGDKDPVVPLSRETDMIEAVRKAGGKPKITTYPGVGHDAWSRTFANPEVLDWLFTQKKG